MIRLVNTLLFTLILSSGILLGCGQKGPLYMEQPPVATESNAPMPQPDKSCPTKRCAATPANSDLTEN